MFRGRCFYNQRVLCCTGYAGQETPRCDGNALPANQYGNANAGTGSKGLAAARKVAAFGRAGGCAPEAVLPFSTGVIGELLPVEKSLRQYRMPSPICRKMVGQTLQVQS